MVFDPQFIHLRVHSAYSLSKGALKVPKIIGLCKENNMPAVGITDINNLFGVIEIAKLCSYDGIQHITGSQITFKCEVPQKKTFYKPLVFIAKNQTGYQNLMMLSTKSYKNKKACFENNQKVDEAFITFDDLKDHSEGIICLTGGDDGIIGSLLIEREYDFANKLISQLYELFNDRLYIELVRYEHDKDKLSIQKKIEPHLLNMALNNNIPIVATNDTYFSDIGMFEAHDALICISNSRYISEENREKSCKDKYFKSKEEMIKLFADLPEAIENTVNISKRCDFIMKERDPILPPYTSDSGLKEDDEIVNKANEGLLNRLEKQVYPEIYSQKLQNEEETELIKQTNDIYFSRLNLELDVIKTMGFPGYFLIVADFIRWAKKQDIPVGPGRGSGAGSLVAWSLTITDIDPIKFNLLFERFLNPERISMPDFDIDFCQDRRNEVINYVMEKYGEDKVAQIITFGKLQPRAVLKDVGRVLEMPYNQVDRASKLIPNNPNKPITLKEAIDSEKSLQEWMKSDETIDRLMNIALKLEGLYRHASTHAAGVVIGGRVLSELVPLYYDEQTKLAITQINMKFVEKAGLLKFDFLGLKTLTVIKNCCDLINKKDNTFDIHSIPLDDRKTFHLLCDANVLGVFQLESGGMKDVIKKLRPDRMEDLIALVALYRPGPMDDIPKYLARKHGEEKVSYLHPKMESILEKTYGVMVYQEQVMQIAQTLGGYTLGAADILRRAMGKKNKQEMDSQRLIFIDGAVNNGIDKTIATQIFDLMAKFASYGFNKSHSAPYALLSYQTAYLKANYPLEFFASLTSYEKNNIEKLTMFLQDLKENSFELLPPHINNSFPNFVPENGALRYALTAIKNVGEQFVVSLVNERTNNGAFISIEDFASRADFSLTNKRQLENLIACGTFDCFNNNRKQLTESLDNIMKYANSCKQERVSSKNLFGTAEEKLKLKLKDEENDFDYLEKSQKEFGALGFFLSSHPLNIYDDIKESLQLQSSLDFKNLSDGCTVRIAAIILSKEERVSKSGQPFAFVMLSDKHSIFEIPFFSESYVKVKKYLVPSLAVYIEATIKILDDDTPRITGQFLRPLEEMLPELAVKIKLKNNIKINEIDIFKNLLKQIKDILESNVESQNDKLNTLFKSNEKLKNVYLFICIKDKLIRIKLPNKYYVNAEKKAKILSLNGVE